MPSEVKAQDTTSLASIKTVNEAATESRSLLSQMQIAAEAADTTLTGIYQDAEDAKTSAEGAKANAENASQYAARALGNLSTVQSVTETLNWITTHGTMTLTTDTALDPTHVYFVQDPNGDYTVGGVKYAIVTEPNADDLSSYYVLSIDESLNNYVQSHLSLTNEGLYVMADNSEWKVLIADNGVFILDPNNSPANQMTENGNIIGYEDETHTEIDYHSLQLIDKEGNTYFHVSDLRDANGIVEITETYVVGTNDTGHYYVNFPPIIELVSATDSTDSTNTAYVDGGTAVVFQRQPSIGATVTIVYTTGSEFAKAYTLGFRKASSTVGALSVAEGVETVASGNSSHAEGSGTTASGISSHAEGSVTTASGWGSHAEGFVTEATGDMSHAEGRDTVASGDYSHAEGYTSTASGFASHAEGSGATASGGFSHAEGTTRAGGTYSHAEGYVSTAEGYISHAEGHNTYAIGTASHAEGRSTGANGTASHAGGFDTSAQYDYQTTIGKHNDCKSDTAFEVGNGTDSARSNAFEVAWDGDTRLYIDTNSASGTDYDINTALQSLGWTDCII